MFTARDLTGTFGLLAVATLALGSAGIPGVDDVPRQSARESAEPTFAEDIAPLLYAHCVACHREGGIAPFSLVNYEDAAPRARRIAAMTSSRRMPPWLPARSEKAFLGERRLTDEQIALLVAWADAGAPAGDPARAPEPPVYESGWQLGAPDVAVEVRDAFTVPAEGEDIFRNFVIPLDLDGPGWVEAVELRPGDPRVVHHATLMVDETPSSREMADREPAPGFGGMHAGTNAQNPAGFLVGWTPGRVARRETDGTAWRIEPGTDLVLQLHLRPSGTEQTVRPVVGLHLTDEPPERTPVLIKLVNELLDIPAGDSAYVVADEFPLPVDVEVLSVYPHAHYLGDEMQVFATLPDGTREDLLHIPDWDFNWQDQFRYEEPVLLPGGSTLHMVYSFDNSAANPQNPNQPPQRVFRGMRSEDEMAELLVQVVPREPDELAILQGWVGLVGTRQTPEEYIAHYRNVVRQRPDDADVRYRLGVALDVAGDWVGAAQELREAVRLDPDWWRPMVALVQVLANRPDGGRPGGRPGPSAVGEAIRLAERAVTLVDREPAAFDALAMAYAADGRFPSAIRAAERAVELARELDRPSLAAEIESRLFGYRNERPYREIPLRR